MYPSKRRNRGKDRRIPTTVAEIALPTAIPNAAFWDASDPNTVKLQFDYPIAYLGEFVDFSGITCDGEPCTALGIDPVDGFVLVQFANPVGIGQNLSLPTSLNLKNTAGGPVAGGDIEVTGL